MWALVLGSFDKQRDVGVLSYLFYLLFKCFVMLGWFEAVSGRLIGPKSWNRSVEIFGTHLDSPWQCRDCFGCLYCKLCNKLCFGE